MTSAREELDLIVDKFAKQIVIANGEVLNATSLTYAIGYLRRTPQVIKVDEHLQALEIIVKKNVDVAVIKISDNVRQYNFETRFIRYHRDELTQEEYDLVSKVVKEITEDEKN